MVTNDTPPGANFDARGLLCPVPVIQLADRITAINIGQTMDVVADDPAARYDIPAWCRMTGQTLVMTREDGADLYFTVRRDR